MIKSIVPPYGGELYGGGAKRGLQELEKGFERVSRHKWRYLSPINHQQLGVDSVW
jgi:hypothetical protein